MITFPQPTRTRFATFVRLLKSNFNPIIRNESGTWFFPHSDMPPMSVKTPTLKGSGAVKQPFVTCFGKPRLAIGKGHPVS